MYFALSRPDASGTRAMMPTPACSAAGSTSSRGFSRNALRMIWTWSPPPFRCRRACAVSSTLTPYAAIARNGALST